MVVLGIGTTIPAHLTELNSMIATSDIQAGNGGTGYTVTEADLSVFTNFS